MNEDILIEVNDTNWEGEVENISRPVVAMFYLPTCIHCKNIFPHFKEFAEKYQDKCVFVMINVGENPWTAERYGVQGTPTFHFLCGGRSVNMMAGAPAPSVLEKGIRDFAEQGDECSASFSSHKYDISSYE